MKLKNIYLQLLIVLAVFLTSVFPVFALQQIAGPLIIDVPIGGSNSTRYGLINDGNETITVSLKVEGDVTPYLSFPVTVDLPPKKLVYTDIVATIPKDYDTSLGGNLYGWLYALQKGEPGQVQINVQMKKNVTILIHGLPFIARETTTQATNTQVNPLPNQSTSPSSQSQLTGFFALSSNYYYVVIIAVFCLVGIFFVIKRKRR